MNPIKLLLYGKLIRGYVYTKTKDGKPSVIEVSQPPVLEVLREFPLEDNGRTYIMIDGYGFPANYNALKFEYERAGTSGALYQKTYENSKYNKVKND